MIGNCRSVPIGVLLVIACSIAVPSASADDGNPAVTCHSSRVDGVDQDVCVGNPGQVADGTPPDDRPRLVPDIRFGVGVGVI